MKPKANRPKKPMRQMKHTMKKQSQRTVFWMLVDAIAEAEGGAQ